MSTPSRPTGHGPVAPMRNAAPERSPLDAEEAAAAAALRALPANDPSPELDARVLAMARAALGEAAPRARSQAAARGRRKPRALWWLGSAAGAVMAAGIGWQLGGFSEPTSPAGDPPSAPVVSGAGAAGANSEFEVLMIPRRPATTGEESAVPSERPTRAGAVPAERARIAPLQPLPASRLEQSTPRSPAPAAPASAAPGEPEIAAPATPPQSTAPQAELPSATMDKPEDAALDEIVVTGSRVAGSDFPPVAQDFRLVPDDWVERIRARRDAGDVESARRSLVAFMRANPQRPVPVDLRPLLSETQ